MLQSTSCKNTVFEILYNTNNTKTNAIDYGIESEDMALKHWKRSLKNQYKNVGTHF